MDSLTQGHWEGVADPDIRLGGGQIMWRIHGIWLGGVSHYLMFISLLEGEVKVYSQNWMGEA